MLLTFQYVRMCPILFNLKHMITWESITDYENQAYLFYNVI